MFKGLSTLRKEEAPKGPPQQNKALQAYLQKYTGEEPSKKKKKKVKTKAAVGAVQIVDNDVSGFERPPRRGPQQAAEEGPSDEEDSDGPVIANLEEAKAFAVQIEKSKNFYGVSRDGSGWMQADEQQAAAKKAATSIRRGRGSSMQQSPPDPDVPRRRSGRSASSSSNESEQDASPPRRRRHDSPDVAAVQRNGGAGKLAGAAVARKRGSSSSPDASPPRRRARHDTPDASPPRRPHGSHGAHEPADASPPRRGRVPAAAAADASPPRRGQRHDSPNASPPRRPAPAQQAQGLPGSRQRHDSPGPDASPPRRRQRHDSPDASPPRRRQRHDSPDASPPRRSGAAAAPAADASPPRRRIRHDSPEALASPLRSRQRQYSPGGDASPPRRVERMADGTVAGLVDSRVLAKEAAEMRKEREQRRLTAEGKDAQTVYRDRETGRIISAEEFAAARSKAKARKEPPPEVHVAWKGGLAQQKAAKEAQMALQAEAAKPFGRSADADADAEAKDRLRWGDPMAGVVKKRKGWEPVLPAPVINEANREALEASGFIVPQEVPPHSWLRRNAPAAPNRYGIRPGRHWDGVDRSNGFERSMFKQQAERAAREMEARQWSQADM